MSWHLSGATGVVAGALVVVKVPQEATKEEHNLYPIMLIAALEEAVAVMGEALPSLQTVFAVSIQTGIWLELEPVPFWRENCDGQHPSVPQRLKKSPSSHQYY